jgi:hypothetical protein
MRSSKRLIHYANFAVIPNRLNAAMLSVSKLSKLQKRILEEGLKAHWCEPIHRAWGSETPGRFGISKILEEFFGANKEDINRPYRRRCWASARAQSRLARERLATPRAAISRAMSRLTKRGFLERIKPTGRGGWRLSAEGVKAASRVCPFVQRPARTELIQKIKEAFLTRKGRIERAGQEMPISWKHFCAGCFLQPQKIRKRPGVKVELDLTGI